MNKNKTIDIVAILIEQHDGLRKIISIIDEQSKKDSSLIVKELTALKKNLQAHVGLENNVFYPSLLEKMENRGMDTKDTENFIVAMKKVEDIVYAFLKNFDSSEDVRVNFKIFEEEFRYASKELKIRISTEEDSVYGLWNILNNNNF